MPMSELAVPDAAVETFGRAETACCGGNYNDCCIRAGLAAARRYTDAQVLRRAGYRTIWALDQRLRSGEYDHLGNGYIQGVKQTAEDLIRCADKLESGQ